MSCFLVGFAELSTHPDLIHFQDPLWNRLLPNAAGHAIKLSSATWKEAIQEWLLPFRFTSGPVLSIADRLWPHGLITGVDTLMRTSTQEYIFFFHWMQEQDFSPPSVGLGLTQHKGRIGADYLGHILSQPCLNSQLDTNSSWTHTYHPVLNNFLTGTEDFQQRNVRTWSGSRQFVGALFWQIKEQLLWELLPGILYGWCWLIVLPYFRHWTDVFSWDSWHHPWGLHGLLGWYRYLPPLWLWQVGSFVIWCVQELLQNCRGNVATLLKFPLLMLMLFNRSLT